MNALPPGWVEASLEDCATVVMGQSPPGRSYNADGHGCPFFQGKAEFGELRPSVRKWTTEGSKFAERDDILLSVRAPVGPTNLAPSFCAIGRGLAAIRPLSAVDGRYLLWALRASAWTLAARSTGTTFGAVSGQQVREHRVPVAPVDEQRRIVAAIEGLFSRLDAAEAALRHAANWVDGLRDSITAAATAGDWPRVRLGDVADDVTYGTSERADRDATGVPVLRMGNVQRGEIDLSDLKYLPADQADIARLALRPGDLLFNRTNSPELVGKAAVFKGGPDPTIFASYLIRVRFLPDCSPDWAALVINGPVGRRYVADVRTQQVGQANVNGTKLRAMPLPLPPVAEQRRVIAEIERRFSLLQSLLATIRTAQARSAALRRAILERAFRGELVPQDPSDEPASVLLERIRAERAAEAPRTSRRRPTRASPA